MYRLSALSVIKKSAYRAVGIRLLPLFGGYFGWPQERLHLGAPAFGHILNGHSLCLYPSRVNLRHAMHLP